MRSWVLLLAAAAAAGAVLGAGARADGPAPTDLIVRLKPGVNRSRFNRDYRVLTEDVTADGFLELLSPAPGTDPIDLSNSMQADPRVSLVEVNLQLTVSELDAQWITAFDGDRDPTAAANAGSILSLVDYG